MVLRRLTAFAALLLCSAFALPAVADVPADWASGQQAFAAGDYESALLYFELARDAGQDGVAVHYNIAVCQFKLSRFGEARATFGYIAANYPKMRGLAEYNLGLVERRLGNDAAARQHFITAWDNSGDDETLQSLAAAMLEELAPPEQPEWYGAVALRVGHDDNVALRDSLGLPAGVTSESPTADLFASLGFNPSGLGELWLDGNVFAVAYPDADDFDQSEFRLGALYTWRPGDWRLRLRARTSARRARIALHGRRRCARPALPLRRHHRGRPFVRRHRGQPAKTRYALPLVPRRPYRHFPRRRRK